VKVPFSEEDDLLLGSSTRSRWCYAASKLLDEFLSLAAYQQYGLPVTIARFFNTVGPGQTGRYGMVVPRFVRQALKGEPLTVYGDGQQSRCFCHVYDVVLALQMLLDQPDITSGEIYNIGSDRETTINELAQQVIDLTKSSSTINYISYNEAYASGFEDMRRRVPDTTKIFKALGWRATSTLKQIIHDVMQFEFEQVRLNIARK
jgi:UDP-glucose 4-epimerase